MQVGMFFVHKHNEIEPLLKMIGELMCFETCPKARLSELTLMCL